MKKITLNKTLIISFCLGIWLACAAWADTNKVQTPTGQPDVLILVFPMPDGQDQISLTYPNIVPHAQAQRDVAALQASTGWAVSGVKVTDALPPVLRAKQKMTGVEMIAFHTFRPETHGFLIEPFVRAFRPYRHIALTYFLGQPFAFQGLRTYADNYVQVSLDQRGSAYTYQILIQNSHFDKLHLPYLQISPEGQHIVNGNTRHPSLWILGLIALLVAGTGFVVYTLLARQA